MTTALKGLHWSILDPASEAVRLNNAEAARKVEPSTSSKMAVDR